MAPALRLLLKTSLRLGPASVARVAAYRLACRSGLYRHLLPQQKTGVGGDFFRAQGSPSGELERSLRERVLERAERLLGGELEYFSSRWERAGAPPDWFLDPFSGSRWPSDGHWSACREFSGGDIKSVWEASRFEWVPVLALAWRAGREARYLAALNAWLRDWTEKNPANTGPNWKCGQEASIRVINLLLAARLLENGEDPAPALVHLVEQHCTRIAPTLGYAVAQNNNHGTSEAAALFIGGGWLAGPGRGACLKSARHWHDLGRRWLEDRVRTLVASDGSFSQYSVNYHRVLLDTLCQVEIWQRELGSPPFGETYRGRCEAATAWLAAWIDPETGEAPNLGANDGAKLYDPTGTPYRDFRPSVQLASLLFRGRLAYPDLAAGWLEALRLDPGEGRVEEAAGSRLFGDGGYVLLRSGETRGLVRFASFAFRPGHADCLHLDLWHRGRNLLRDGGTFSYNTEPVWYRYFSGTESHNTVQFDDRDQMPRLGRFLFGEWLSMERVTPIRQEGEAQVWSGAYRDFQGARHLRTVTANGNKWLVRDEIGCFLEKAVLRWRLIPADWEAVSGGCESVLARLRVTSSVPLRRMELVTGWESLHYQQKTPLPVLELEVGPGECVIETEITLKD